LTPGYRTKPAKMKKSIVLIAVTLFYTLLVFSQDAGYKTSRLRDLAGKQIIASTFDNAGKPYIVCFWAIGNGASQQLLNTIADQYAGWQKATGVKIITVAVDDAQNSAKVIPFFQSKGWVYENYLDQDQDYMHAMHVNNVPHVFVFNGQKEIIFQLSSYNEGDEKAIYDAVKRTLN